MTGTKEFLTEMQKQRQRFFPEAPVIYLEELSFYVKARIILSENSFIECRFNAHNGKRGYTLVRDGKRIAGFDNLGGWHIHPFGKSDAHRRIREPSLADVFEYFIRAL